MPKILKTISLDKKSDAEIERLRKAFGISTSRKVQVRSAEVVRQLTLLAVEAFQAAVPRDTEELLNQIDSNEKKINSANPFGEVFIGDESHRGRDPNKLSAKAFKLKGEKDSLKRNQNLLGAAALAEFLDAKSPYKRSQPSKAVGPFDLGLAVKSPHKGWINAGKRAFDREYKRLLNG